MGALHEISYGRPSLACDLVEEYRTFLGDRLVLGLINRKSLSPDDFIFRQTGRRGYADEKEMRSRRPVEMRPPIRRAFVAAYEQMMKRTVSRGPEAGKATYRWLMMCQVRAFGEYLQDPEKIYPPFVWDI
jgi:CRISPR-associated protein Cas1